jgi:hypothetical protein
MNTHSQTIKKTTGIAANGAVVSNPVKPPVNVPSIAADSDKQISYWRDQTEDFFTELSKLRCLSGLLNGQNEHNNINLSELCYLIDPSVDRLKEICDELSNMFNKKQVAFLLPAGEHAKHE